MTTDRLAEWLREKHLFYQRRLTGSWRGGQHFIMCIQWGYPYLLIGSDSAWNVYQTKPTRLILSDSVRATALLLSLIFRFENQELAPVITTRIFSPHARKNRLLFDVSPNSMNRGRRSILSLHKTSFNVCIPYDNPLPSTKEELYDLVSLDAAKSGEIVFSESLPTAFMKKHNTRQLKSLISQYEWLLHEYVTTPRLKFEEKRFGMPVNYP